MPEIYVSQKKQAVNSKQQIVGHTHNPLAAFSAYPDKAHFETQEAQEKIVLLLRRHPITNIPWIVAAALMLVAPGILGYLPILSFLPTRFQLVGILIWYLVAVAFILEQFLTWFFNVYIVTDERVVDVDFLNLIYKEVSDAKIDKIQDVTYKMGGFVRTIFNYGDVFIQTAAEVPNFEFAAVPNPAQISRILQELRSEEEQEALEGRVR